MESTPLAVRMKRYEHSFRRILPKRTYTLLRMDGRAFHTFTKHCQQPFDLDLADAMNQTAVQLCKQIAGAQFAYVQSDEISLLLTDFANYETEPWMGGVEAKQISLSAAMATAFFNQKYSHPQETVAVFDSRVWCMTDPYEVANYFIWRQRDCIKNSVSMAAQTVASHKDLHGLNTAQRELLLLDHDIRWDDYPDGFKYGRFICKDTENAWTITRKMFTTENLLLHIPQFG